MAMVLRSPSSSSSTSSSSSSNISGFSYDVFLSFRGKDTRKTFTDHLYTALNQAGISTFRDDDAMERGRLLKPELEKAIHQSQVSLIVFSKGYATSKWCLDEVLMIMEEYDQSSSTNKRRDVVPVFYNIEPTDVRNQTGCFEEAFKGYIDEVTREKDVEKKMELLKKVEAWRSCLRKAGSITGMVPSTDGYEAKFISSIIKVIRKKLKYNALYIDEKLVGIAKNIVEIESWLQDPSPHAMIYVLLMLFPLSLFIVATVVLRGFSKQSSHEDRLGIKKFVLRVTLNPGSATGLTNIVNEDDQEFVPRLVHLKLIVGATESHEFGDHDNDDEGDEDDVDSSIADDVNDDLTTRIEEFIAMNVRKWKEEMHNDKLLYLDY